MKKRLAISASFFAALAALAMMSTLQPAAQEASAPTGGQSLDFEFFKTRVEPVFLKKRPGHTRCYACHVTGERRLASRTAFHLQPLSPGDTFWTEEQSRLNFQSASLVVIPGEEPTSSRLLMHPLAREAGGDSFHGGGRQFASQDDPDWKIMESWVRGQKAGGSSDK